MGGMIVQAYALAYPNNIPDNPKMLSLTMACTYAQPTAFCTRMFALWADMAKTMSVQDVMRDVLLWAFTVPFFREREAEVEEFEKAMMGLDMSLEAYLAQLNVIQKFDSVAELKALKDRDEVLGGLEKGRVMVLAGEEDILIPVVLSKDLQSLVKGSAWKTGKGGHGCMWEFPDDFNKIYLSFLEGR